MQAGVVEFAAGIYFERLFCDSSGRCKYLASIASERGAVDIHFRPMGIGSVVLENFEVGKARRDGIGLFAFIGQIHFEDGWLAEGNAANALLVELNLWILYLQSTGIQLRVGVVEDSGTPVFPRLRRGTASGTIDKSPWTAVEILFEVVEIEVTVEIGLVFVHSVKEILAGEHVHGISFSSILHQIGSIDIEAEMAAVVHADSERLLTVVRFGFSVLWSHSVRHRGIDEELDTASSEIHLCGVIDTIVVIFAAIGANIVGLHDLTKHLHDKCTDSLSEHIADIKQSLT